MNTEDGKNKEEFKYELGADGKIKYKFKSDLLFKMIFAEYSDLRKSLVAAALGVPKSSIEEIRVKNPEILPEEIQDKFCKLDLNLEVDGEQLDIEIQLADEGNYKDRAATYLSKLHAGGLESGKNYMDAPKSTLISFVDFKLFDCEEVRSEFGLYEKNRHELLTDKVGLIFYELKKLPEEIDEEDSLQVWLKVLSAETKDDFKELEQSNLKEVEQAMEAYKKITGDERFRELERQREKTRHDEANALSVAEKRGEKRKDDKYLDSMRNFGLSEEDIAIIVSGAS